MRANTGQSRAVPALLFLGALLLPDTALAATAGGIYDMDAMLREPHPFTRPYVPAPAAPAYGASPPAGIAPPPPMRSAAPSPMPAPMSVTAPSPIPVAAASRPVPAPPPGSAVAAGRGSFLDIFSEVRGGLLAHDFGPFSHRKEDGADINAELLFASPSFMEMIWSPRPTLGGSLNSSGDTSQAYAGLTWEWEFLQDGFFSFFWGGAFHNGEKNAQLPDKKDLGCSVLFREGIDLGWRFAGNHALMIHFDHISNAKLCDQNEGLESLGLRYGYRF